MNNGKVRIYELSKELDLDNRDILEVCGQLNISAKSHSSTITEQDANRIRTAAEKYTPSRSSSSKHAAAGHSTGARTKSTASKAPVKKKQQILEVRKHRPTTADSPKRPEVAAKPPVSRPQPPSTPPAPTPPSATPEQPEKAVPVEASNSDSAVAEYSALPELQRPSASKPMESPDDKVDLPDQELDSVDHEQDEDEDVPELIKPPARPTEDDTSPQPTTVERPILKRSKPQRSDSSKPERRDANEAEIRQPVKSDQNGRSGQAPEVKKPSAPRPKPATELRRPPSRPSTEETRKKDEPRDDDDLVAIPDDTTDLELRRPMPPRPPKRQKNRVEEEDDEQQELLQRKAPKTKRRTQPVIEEEEEEDLDDMRAGNEVSQSQVSLSLMRPPKPKNYPGQKKTASVTPASQRPKKSDPTKDTSRSQRRDRRESENKPERPELITLTDSISVHDLAEALTVPETEVIKVLFHKGIAANINQILDIPTATMVAEEFEVRVETAEAEAEAKKTTEMLDEADLDSLQRRPPVVTIMGHVDHGKTTLLDSIRKTKVAQGEAGGITQHIGAYHVDVTHGDTDQQVVFLDTPGHEAFTAMRARGARVTDIAVLVVAADDGVRPQTIEAISHAKAAGVPIVVAINKVDKEGAQPDRVKQELTEHGLVSEEWGGDTIMVPVSAITGDNLDTLLEMLLLVSEVEDLYANPDRSARGTVIEANLDKARGPVATLLVQNGTLRVGDSLVAGSAFGKVRAMIDDRGRRVEAADPSFAVEVLGLNDVPAAGDEFEVFTDEKEARSVSADRTEQQRQSRLQQAMASRRVSLNSFSAQAQEGELKELNLILKADVQGSVEAILASLQQLPQKEVQVRVLLAAPGEVTETDVDLAAASSAVIVGFNTTLASGARQAADRAGVDVREYNIIYKLLEDIEGAMEGLLEPEMVEEPLGQVQVRAVFPVGKGSVAGCYVQSGKVIRNCRVRVRRGSEVVYEGNLDSLKRMKDDVKEVNAGYECGIGIDRFNSWEEGDIIETFRMVSKRRTLSA
ncbi:MAG: translation initiation factor IF-2 [Elainellaceae cyanobacterium]